MDMTLQAIIEVSCKFMLGYDDISKNFDWLARNLDNKKFLVPFTILDQRQEEFYITFDKGKRISKITVQLNIPLLTSSLPDEEIYEGLTKEAIERDIYSNEFEVRIFDLLFALEIANPGCFNYVNISLYMDGNKIKNRYQDRIYASYAEMAREDELFSPIIKAIDIDKVWAWINNISDLWEEVSSSKVGVALNYYRYFYYEDSPLGVMWLSMALESILVTNQSFSQSQIKGKLAFILKEHLTKDQINGLVDEFYTLRSKIAHGKLKLFRPTLLADALNEVQKLHLTISNNCSFGVVALIGCIHFMILNGLKELNFKEKIIYELCK